MRSRNRKVDLSPGELKEELRRRSRRGFLAGGIAAAVGVGGFEWLTRSAQEDNAPWPQRRVLALNEKLAHSFLKDSRRMPEYRGQSVGYLKPNGDYGLKSDLDLDEWRLKVATTGKKEIELSLSDLKSLPKRELTTRFCCIEGWSVIASWAGVRLADFTSKFAPSGMLLPYVSMTTPDEDYYVGLDAKSAFHPQTLLAYEHNGQPLTNEHGAPLRLVIPVKYGIKNIKRIGTIQYTSQRPSDYWAEEGYDWFAGL
jgi:DMSO/TMAO reductase YedYZ molybdopterin-dependent catalytic subunit